MPVEVRSSEGLGASLDQEAHVTRIASRYEVGRMGKQVARMLGWEVDPVGPVSCHECVKLHSQDRARLEVLMCLVELAVEVVARPEVGKDV